MKQGWKLLPKHLLCLALLVYSPLGLAAKMPAPACRQTILDVIGSTEEAYELSGFVNYALSLKDIADGEKAQLQLLETALKNPATVKALAQGNKLVIASIKKILTLGSSQKFYRDCEKLFFALRPPGYHMFLRAVTPNILPATFPLASSFPQVVFKSKPKMNGVLSMRLGALFGNDPTLKPLHFTRRLFAFMGRNRSLTAEQKFYVLQNFVDEYNRQRAEFSRDRPPSKALKPYNLYLDYPPTSDGTLIICGTPLCKYYFAIKADGTFFHGHRPPQIHVFDPERWETYNLNIEAVPN